MTADHLDSVLHPQFAGQGKVLAKGLAASPGAAVGKVYFTADDADEPPPTAARRSSSCATRRAPRTSTG